MKKIKDDYSVFIIIMGRGKSGKDVNIVRKVLDDMGLPYVKYFEEHTGRLCFEVYQDSQTYKKYNKGGIIY